ncbi:CARDB domain-containing protein [Desulfoscipio gibsoniae]
MLKKISSLLLIAFLLTAVPAGAALALPQGEEQEQVVKQEVIMGQFDIWKGTNWLDTNNDGDPDKPGQTGKITKPFNYDAVDKLGEYELTRVEVQYPFTTDEYIAAGGRIYGPNGKPWIDSETGDSVMSWKDFKFHYLKYLPQNLSVQVTSQDMTAGQATVKWGLDLIEQNQGGTLDLKKSENRQYIGYEPDDFGSLVEGWRWYLPAIITWYGVPKQVVQPPNNLAVTITSHPEDAQQGEAVTVTGEIASDSETPVTTLAQWYLDSNKIFEGEVTINKKRNLTFPFSMPNKDTLVTVQVNPSRDKPANETTWEDNKDKAMIQLAAAPAQGNSQLILTAKSQGGKDMSGKYVPPQQRPDGTAKWTDTVTATLKPPTPTPPKGTLKSWSITSAKLTYPKKNERFSFGSPYPPQGTVTINMTNGGHTSTVTFKQDWGMDGAKIYSQFEQKLMAAKKKPYPITATYTIKYTYEYKVKHRSCKKTGSGKRSCHTWYETKTGTGTDSGTVTAQLLVNGTGVNSLSN